VAPNHHYVIVVSSLPSERGGHVVAAQQVEGDEPEKDDVPLAGVGPELYDVGEVAERGLLSGRSRCLARCSNLPWMAMMTTLLHPAERRCRACEGRWRRKRRWSCNDTLCHPRARDHGSGGTSVAVNATAAQGVGKIHWPEREGGIMT
jgi:hypothetical protein